MFGKKCETCKFYGKILYENPSKEGDSQGYCYKNPPVVGGDYHGTTRYPLVSKKNSYTSHYTRPIEYCFDACAEYKESNA